MPAPRPWYSFAFTALGPHGAVLAAAVSLIGAAVTAREAYLWAMNRVPAPAEVADLQEPGCLRWVEVDALELRLHPQLVPSAATGEPTDFHVYETILIDRASPQAARWEALRRRVHEAILHARAAPREVPAVCTRLAEEENALRQSIRDYLPEEAIVLVCDPSGRVEVPDVYGDPAARANLRDLAAGVFEDGSVGPGTIDPVVAGFVRDWIALVDQFVRPGVRIRGVLERIPSEVEAHYEAPDPYGIEVRYALSAGEEPSSLGATLFGVFIGVLVLVGVGFVGIWQAAPAVEESRASA